MAPRSASVRRESWRKTVTSSVAEDRVQVHEAGASIEDQARRGDGAGESTTNKVDPP
jgi:hypothetical protein